MFGCGRSCCVVVLNAVAAPLTETGAERGERIPRPLDTTGFVFRRETCNRRVSGRRKTKPARRLVGVSPWFEWHQNAPLGTRNDAMKNLPDTRPVQKVSRILNFRGLRIFDFRFFVALRWYPHPSHVPTSLAILNVRLILDSHGDGLKSFRPNKDMTFF